MATIYLYQFNNYYNRVIKKLNKDNSGALRVPDSYIPIAIFNNINVHYTDGVNCELIVNNYDPWADYETADYVLIEDTTNVNIQKTSAWFIMEASRLRNGQCRLMLYRDLVNTYYDDIVKAPCFIEKATLLNNNDLIFNSENMSYNQIKTWEKPLYDCTRMPWIVGYLSKDATALADRSFSTASADRISIGVSHSSWTKNKNFKFIRKEDVIIVIRSRTPLTATGGAQYKERWLNYDSTIDDTYNVGNYNAQVNDLYIDNVRNSWFNYDIVTSNIRAIREAENETYLDEMLNLYNNQVIQFSDGLYKVTVTRTLTEKVQDKYTNNTNSLSTYLLSRLQANISGLSILGNAFGYECVVDSYEVNLTEVQAADSYKYTIPNTVAKLNSATYRMFAIPYPISLEKAGYANRYYKNTTFICDLDSSLALSWANSIAREAGANLLDLQILPYCPLASTAGNGIKTNVVQNKNTNLFYLDSGTEGVDFIYLKKSSNDYKVGVCFFLRENTFSIPIGYNLTTYGVPSKDVNINVLDYKIESECDMYRICSPNYAGVFEINAAKNGGLRNFEADCTYRPYNPYICVHPEFNRLYGNNYEDARGLICGGDFSLDIEKSEWVNYELQNKNYQKTFQRQIENMEVNNSITNQNAFWQTAAGTIAGATSGAMAGALSGGGVYGAAIGGIAGGASSLVAGVTDIQNQKKLQAETLDYTKDLYGYQLGNIQALPTTLAKVSSLTANSKYIPFLEYYTCTDAEKEALRNKIKYNGMTVGVIGKIEDYQLTTTTYIKGKIIRFDTFANIDFHEANVIAEEINKGVFI